MWYGRYIDDLIFIWGQDVVSISHFFEYVNNNTSNLKFTVNFSNVSVNFLDLTLRGDCVSSKVIPSIYRKPGAENTILSPFSNHPKYTTISAIPMGEFIRVKRACSSPDTLKSSMQDTKHRLKTGGYNRRILDQAEGKLQTCNRKELLFGDSHIPPKNAPNLVFSTPYKFRFCGSETHFSLFLTHPK